jgi:hypothetical protein
VLRLCAFIYLMALMIVAPEAASAQQSDGAGWRTYADPKLGTSVQYPAGIFSVEGGAEQRQPGRLFETPDGRAKLSVYTMPNDHRDSPASFLKTPLRVNSGVFDYRRVTSRFFVLSGVREGMVFYSRCNFSRNPPHRIGCIYLRYPEEETKSWDRIVTRISLSLRS